MSDSNSIRHSGPEQILSREAQLDAPTLRALIEECKRKYDEFHCMAWWYNAEWLRGMLDALSTDPPVPKPSAEIRAAQEAAADYSIAWKSEKVRVPVEKGPNGEVVVDFRDSQPARIWPDLVEALNKASSRRVPPEVSADDIFGLPPRYICHCGVEFVSLDKFEAHSIKCVEEADHD